MNQQIEENQTDNKRQTDYLWLLNCSLVTAVAVFLRFYWLELKPMHHDEGVNGYFLTTLFREGKYAYDPTNYHGPDLYYFSLAFSKVFGLNTISVRASVAIFGVFTVLLAFFLKKYIGKIGSIAAALFIALSPGMVYISRYFIHEMIFVFFSLGIVVSVLYFIEGRKAGVFAIVSMSALLLVCFSPAVATLPNVFAEEFKILPSVIPWHWKINLPELFSAEPATLVLVLTILFFLIEAVLVFFVMRMLIEWNEGRPIYLLLASACAVMLCATKETVFITLGTMAIACICAWLWRNQGIFWYLEAFKNYSRFNGRAGRTEFWAFYLINLFFAFVTIALDVVFHRSFQGTWIGPIYLFYSLATFLPLAAITVRRLHDVGKSGTYFFLFFIPILNIWLIIMLLTKGSEGKNKYGNIPASTTKLGTSFDEILGKFKKDNLEKVELTWSNFRAALGNSTDLLLITIAALAVFIYVGVLFFSSFFTNPEGVIDWFKAYAVWTKAGTKDHTQNGMWGYLKWGMKIESPIFVLSAIGTLIALIKARHRFAIFTGFWAFGMFAAYTLIPYKTPWLALSFILPMCIIAGYAVGEMLRARDIVVKVLGGLIAMMATAILGYQSYDLNFVKYDDEDMVYVYAHTKRKFHDLIKEIEYYAEKSGKGKDATIEIVSPDYWSMPWYMNDYDHANFHGQFVDANTSEMIVIKKDEQDGEAITRYASHYKYVGTYPLRPGVDLRLLVRKDLADPSARDMFLMEGSEALTVTPDDGEGEEEETKTP